MERRWRKEREGEKREKAEYKGWGENRRSKRREDETKRGGEQENLRKKRTTEHNENIIGYTLSTAGNPWAALRGALRNHFWQKRRPQPYWRGANSGNTLEASNALNYRGWGIPAVLSRGIPGNFLKSFSRDFPELFQNSFRKVPAVPGVWPT